MIKVGSNVPTLSKIKISNIMTSLGPQALFIICHDGPKNY